MFVKVKSNSDLPMAIAFPRSFNRSPLWLQRTYYPAWFNTTQNIHKPLPHKTAFPTPKGSQRVDKLGWIWGVHDAGNCGAAGGIETGRVLVGKNSTDFPSEALLWRGAGSQCVTTALAPRATSGWIDVGRLMDTLDHSSWNLPAGNYSLQFGQKLNTDRDVTPIPDAVFDAQPSPKACNGTWPAGARKNCDEPGWLNGGTFTTVLLDASIRASRRTRPVEAEFFSIMADLDSRSARPNQTASRPLRRPRLTSSANA